MIKKFLKQTHEVYIKTFCKKWEGETQPKWPFILQMPKRILSSQSKFNKFLQTYIIFLIKQLFVKFVNEEFFFSKIYRDGIKNIFQNIWKMIRMARVKHSNNNF